MASPLVIVLIDRRVQLDLGSDWRSPLVTVLIDRGVQLDLGSDRS